MSAPDLEGLALVFVDGANGRPDPSLRPWPAAPDRPWQSPDIEVRNAKNATDPAWANVPWVGNMNTVVAKVRNNGTVPLTDVRVGFRYSASLFPTAVTQGNEELGRGEVGWRCSS